MHIVFMYMYMYTCCVYVRLACTQGIPYDKRMAMMEFQLRNFQTLTEGTKVTLTYELNRYTLKVLECKPEKGKDLSLSLPLSLLI